MGGVVQVLDEIVVNRFTDALFEYIFGKKKKMVRKHDDPPILPHITRIYQ